MVALCAYPVVRGLTRRLERLQTGVETLGAGQLSARVKVEGRDEVARLATSFNAAAGRIEDLVNAHRMLLANTSHELRTPLARIRLGLELFKKDGDPKHKQDLERDIAELDGLLDEILLASRLEVNPALQREDVDLLALAAEEAAHYDQTDVEGDAVTIRGDARLLRRLIRNLLENARRHGKPPVRVEVRRDGDRALHRCDRLRPRRSARRPRADFRAVSPARRRVIRRGSWLVALPPDRAAARRRCRRRRARGCAQRVPGDAADQSSLKPYSGTLPELP